MTRRSAVFAFIALIGFAGSAFSQRLLIPMDDDQQNHLKAYGLTYNSIKGTQKAEWLLN